MKTLLWAHILRMFIGLSVLLLPSCSLFKSAPKEAEEVVKNEEEEEGAEAEGAGEPTAVATEGATDATAVAEPVPSLAPPPVPEPELVAPVAEQAAEEAPVAEPAPEAAPVAVMKPVEVQGGSVEDVNYVIRKGDSLSKIAKKVFGDLHKWKDIAGMNAFIKNPNLIFPGDVIAIKASTGESQSFAKNYNAKVETTKVTEIVQKGDTLEKIAKRSLGDGSGWKYIWHLNHSAIPNPNRLKVGTKLYFSTGVYNGMHHKKQRKDKKSK